MFGFVLTVQFPDGARVKELFADGLVNQVSPADGYIYIPVCHPGREFSLCPVSVKSEVRSSAVIRRVMLPILRSNSWRDSFNDSLINGFHH